MSLDFVNRVKYLGFSVAFLFSSQAGAEIFHHPGLMSIEGPEVQTETVHRLITSRVKRMGGDVQPESAEFVRGKKVTETFELSAAHDTEVVARHYAQQFANSGQVLFECQGRSCGPSNYWSNEVFEKPRLYGPLEYQYYLLAQLDDDEVDYVLLYFSQRGTGKRFLHQVTISDVDEGITADKRVIGSMLRLQRRFVFDLQIETLNAVRDVINENPDLTLAVVAHSGSLLNESLDESVSAAQARAEEVKETLTNMGANTRNLAAFGAGPTAPLSAANPDRYELVKLN